MINGISFDSTLKVVQRDVLTAVEYENCHEIYETRRNDLQNSLY